jgi:Tol biopolymer transport system component
MGLPDINFHQCLSSIINAGIIAAFAAVLVTDITRAEVPKFTGNSDIGTVNIPGSVEYKKNTISITGSGENIWSNKDAFHFIYNTQEGDLRLATNINWIGIGKNPHRKAGLMIREGLTADDAYVDAVIHGDGLISMQYRTVKGENTFEVRSPIKAPARLILERTANQFTLFVSDKSGGLHTTATISVNLGNQVFSGLVVCSHDSTVKETAVFTDVEYTLTGKCDEKDRIEESTLETYDIETGIRTVIRKVQEHFEAPNWSRDGKYFLFNSKGKIFKLPINEGEPVLVNTGLATTCNNDHGISSDGKQLVISNHDKEGKSYIYVLPILGGEPRKVTLKGPSYWHGWSPDGKTLTYCAERNGEFDVYTIPVTGGEEKRLTNSPGLDDGPEYSPDGKYIYFNSVRTGQMKIWRMLSDGSEQTQFTPTDQFGDWFAHPSPDNQNLVFVSYDKSVDGHPANKDVVVRMMPVRGGEAKTIITLFGGQGTMNVHSWSPNSKQFAFVSYRLVAPKKTTNSKNK